MDAIIYVTPGFGFVSLYSKLKKAQFEVRSHEDMVGVLVVRGLSEYKIRKFWAVTQSNEELIFLSEL